MSDPFGVLDGLGDPIFVSDAVTGRMLFINTAGRDLLGLAHGAPMAEIDLDNLVAGPDFSRARGRELIRKAAQEGVTELRWPGRRTDGQTMWLDVVLTPTEADGRAVVVITARDVTESVTMQEALDRSEGALEDANRMLQIVLDTIPVRVFWKDREGRFLGCNQRFADDAGKTAPSDLIGEDDYAQGWANEADLYRGDDRRVVESGRAKINFEEPQTTPDGRTIWLRTSKLPLRDRGGAVIGLLGTYEDITEARNTVEILRESEAKLRTTLDSIGEGVIVVDGGGTIRRLNRVACQLLGRRIEEVMGRPLEGVLHLTHATTHENVANVLEAAHDNEVEAFLVDESGRARRVAVAATPLKGGSDPRGAVLVLRDITQAHKLHEELQQAQKMEAIGQLAGGVAHDFNNLLQAIVGYLDLCLLDPNLPNDIAANLDQIGTAADRAIALTGQLLAFSRREAMVRDSVQPASLIESIIRLVDRLIGEHIVVATKVEDGLSAIFIDRAQMEVCLLNLCINARDAMTRGGTLTVSARRADDGPWLEVVTGPAEDFVAIEVADTGVGIPEKHRERVFEPFFTTKGVGQGTGLGLSTVYAVIERHGGTVELDSHLGEGTRLVLYLPVASAKLPARRPTARAVPGVRAHGRPACILLAEDDDLVRRLATTILDSAGYEVVVARDGPEAVSHFEADRDRIDIAVLDVVMPGLSGREVRDIIQAARPDIPVLLCSGYTREILEDTGLDTTSLIHKPYAPQVLISRVQELLGARSFP